LNLTLRTRYPRYGTYGSTLSLLHIWLGTEAGNELMDRLTSVETLTVDKFEPPRDGTAVMSTFLAKGWASLLRLQSITSLILHKCDIPSWQTIFDIFTVSYPHLHTVEIWEVCLVNTTEMTTPSNPTMHIVSTKLRKLDMRNGYLGDDDLNKLLGSMHCSMLTHLILAPTEPPFNADGPTFVYAQPLLHNAAVLTSLSFVDCDMLLPGNSPPLLTSNVAIQHLCF
jgi:hypothetical protein